MSCSASAIVSKINCCLCIAATPCLSLCLCACATWRVCVCVCARANTMGECVSVRMCVLLVFNPFLLLLFCFFWREWGRGCAMCRETSGEATSVPPQVPPTRSPPPNSYRTCSTPTSESPLGCPLRTQTPQPSEAETDWEGGREKENHTEKSKGSRAKKPFLKPHSTRAFSFISFDHSVLFFLCTSTLLLFLLLVPFRDGHPRPVLTT